METWSWQRAEKSLSMELPKLLRVQDHQIRQIRHLGRHGAVKDNSVKVTGQKGGGWRVRDL
jgi:hypothetical protein